MTAPPSAELDPGGVEAAPGSDSAVYAPNPAAIVVAIDAGHGGCLDWGVPDPSERGEQLAEKTLTLEIALDLRDLLSAQGIGVVMIRDEDEALAGDNYSPLGCEGPPWRDVNGDGLAGFGPDLPEATRTRDELQARLDLANVAQADALISIHINAPSDGGQRIEIAFSETFYTDETPWGATATARLAEAMQAGVVDRLDPIADYERGDRGITAHNFYLVAPPLLELTPERADPLAQPTRGGLMPVVLAEVGSITLRTEHDLLASTEGQRAVAEGLLRGLTDYLGERELAARISLADEVRLERPAPVEGDGPLFWAAIAPSGPISLRLTNTGTTEWPSGAELVAGWTVSDQPYLAVPPTELAGLDTPVPPLGPGESVVLSVELPSASEARSLAWISLMVDGTTTADLGSPALQLSSETP
ncbi:MAG: N-acetylmuramoyl-L-alanine amidase [Chloroflexota bacterium]|nr:N-acetylmuramoyl-L-alanine amidase [Chloroflexota bacterium]